MNDNLNNPLRSLREKKLKPGEAVYWKWDEGLLPDETDDICNQLRSICEREGLETEEGDPLAVFSYKSEDGGTVIFVVSSCDETFEQKKRSVQRKRS